MKPKKEIKEDLAFKDVSVCIHLAGKELEVKDFIYLKYRTGYKAEIILTVPFEDSQVLQEKIGKHKFDLVIKVGKYVHKIDKCELFVSYEFNDGDENLYSTLTIDNVPRL